MVMAKLLQSNVLHILRYCQEAAVIFVSQGEKSRNSYKYAGEELKMKCNIQVPSPEITSAQSLES